MEAPADEARTQTNAIRSLRHIHIVNIIFHAHNPHMHPYISSYAELYQLAYVTAATSMSL